MQINTVNPNFVFLCLSALVIPILDQDHNKVLAILLVREKKSNAADSASSFKTKKVDYWELI